MAEPSGTWSTDAVALSGRVDGSELVLSGQKSFVDNFRTAGQCLVACRMADGSGLALVLVDPQAPGIAAVDLITTAADAAVNVTFDDVRVPLSDMVGSPARGRLILSELMDLAAVFTTALLGGRGRRGDRAGGGIRQGPPRLRPADRLVPGHPAHDGRHDDRRGWRPIAGARGDLAARLRLAGPGGGLAGQGVRQREMPDGGAHGAADPCGIGFIAEFDQQLWYRRVASWSLRCGTTLDHRARVAAALLDRPGKVRLGFDLSPEETNHEMAAEPAYT